MTFLWPYQLCKVWPFVSICRTCLHLSRVLEVLSIVWDSSLYRSADTSELACKDASCCVRLYLHIWVSVKEQTAVFSNICGLLSDHRACEFDGGCPTSVGDGAWQRDETMVSVVQMCSWGSGQVCHEIHTALHWPARNKKIIKQCEQKYFYSEHTTERQRCTHRCHKVNNCLYPLHHVSSY